MKSKFRPKLEKLKTAFGTAVIVILLLAFVAKLVAPLIFRGNRPLHEAVERGDANRVRRLLEEGADPNSTDGGVSSGSEDLFDTLPQSPLLAAVRGKRADIVALLIDKGANLNWAGNTLLSAAIENGDLEIIRLLLDRGVKVSQQTASLAVRAGRLDITELVQRAVETRQNTDKGVAP